MAAACLVGSTGLVGSNILSTLSSHPGCNVIHAYSRKGLPLSEKLKPIISAESAQWPSQYPSGVPLFISALGTTRGHAGGFEKQRLIDYDLNLELAKAAKAAGTKTYVLISSTGANSSSMLGYTKMKGELEEAVKALDFEHTVILRPGLIVGKRLDHRPQEFVLSKIAEAVGGFAANRLKDFWAQDADVIGKAAVSAGLRCINGEEKEKVNILGQADIVRLGRTEWKGY